MEEYSARAINIDNNYYDINGNSNNRDSDVYNIMISLN